MIFVFNFYDYQMTLKESLIDYSNDYKYSIDYIIELFEVWLPEIMSKDEISQELKEEFQDMYQELCENGEEEEEVVHDFNNFIDKLIEVLY